jgi:NAD(P)H-hydrate epimerase
MNVRIYGQITKFSKTTGSIRRSSVDIPFSQKEIPYLSTKQMIEVDRAMMQDYKIGLIQMMENAGRNLAHLARVRFLDGNPEGKQVIILAGTGGNGGGALVSARRLHNWGAKVHVFITKPDEDFKSVSAVQLDILRRMNVQVAQANVITSTSNIDLIMDGLIGYSLKGAPYGTNADLIRWANNQPAPILALDVPSGIDTSTGTVFDPAIRAEATMTLALPKEGLRVPGVRKYVGELYLADISVPRALYSEPALALQVGTIFAESDILRLW